jgi:methyltransferase (TIGR00027 family)
VREADAETHERPDGSIEEALETGRLLEWTGWLTHRHVPPDSTASGDARNLQAQEVARIARALVDQGYRMSAADGVSGSRCRIECMRTASRTAELVALYRAIESSRSAATRLFIDPLAPAFLGSRFRWALRAYRIPAIGAAVPWSIIDGHWSGPRGTVAVRTRYIDDVLGDALRRGADQVVILGAGFDCRAYRIPGIERTRVFEVDHPATQAKKKAIITRRLSAVPPHVTFVPVDFSTDSLDTVMPRSGYRRDTVTFFICEGVTHYLSPEAVDTIFRHVVQNAQAGSQIVFTYIHRGLVDGSVSFAGGDDTLSTVRRVGEPYTFGFDPAALPRHLSALGLEMIEDVGASQYRERFLQPRGRAGEPLAEFQRAAVAQVAR